MIKRQHKMLYTYNVSVGKIMKDKSPKRNLTNSKTIQTHVYYDCLNVITFYTDGEKYSKHMNL